MIVLKKPKTITSREIFAPANQTYVQKFELAVRNFEQFTKEEQKWYGEVVVQMSFANHL